MSSRLLWNLSLADVVRWLICSRVMICSTRAGSFISGPDFGSVRLSDSTGHGSLSSADLAISQSSDQQTSGGDIRLLVALGPLFSAAVIAEFRRGARASRVIGVFVSTNIYLIWRFFARV